MNRIYPGLIACMIVIALFHEGGYLYIRDAWRLTPTGGLSRPNNLYADHTGFDRNSPLETVA